MRMHVAVLGAGYAGISLVRELERNLPADIEITLIDERDSHLVQHLIHRIVRKPGLSDALTVPISDIIGRAEHRQARVTGIDAEEGTVELADETLSYDAGALCLGARTEYYGLPGVENHTTPLKRAEDAERIREEFDLISESGGRVVVGGAGLSGIQVAGELAELAADAPAEVDVVLLEQESTVAPQFPSRFRKAVSKALDEQDVDIRSGRTVASAGEDSIQFADGEELPYDQFVWTGGIAGQDAVGERPTVNATLRLGERTFAAGDAARVIDADGEQVPASAQTAVRQANTAARNIERLCTHFRSERGFPPRLDRYRYQSLGWLVSIGDRTIAQVGPSVLTGKPAEALKTTVGAGYLTNIGAVEDATDYIRESFHAH